jgi:hypothetical protein
VNKNKSAAIITAPEKLNKKNNRITIITATKLYQVLPPECNRHMNPIIQIKLPPSYLKLSGQDYLIEKDILTLLRYFLLYITLSKGRDHK